MECEKLISKSKSTLVGFACLIDRSTKKTLKITRKKIVSQVKLNVPTYKKSNLPKSLKELGNL